VTDGDQEFYEYWRNHPDNSEFPESFPKNSNFPDTFPYELSLGARTAKPPCLSMGMPRWEARLSSSSHTVASSSAY